jgi:hypothetical protein
MLFIFDLGYFKVKALASIATVGAYFFCRLNHQTNLYETVAGRLCPVKLAGFLATVEHALPLLEKAVSIGANECVASRLIAVRMPEVIVNERRRRARKKCEEKRLYAFPISPGTVGLEPLYYQCAAHDMED